MQENDKELQCFLNCFKILRKFFNNDTEKMASWFIETNPLLGGLSPLQMIKIGRYKKIESFINSSLEENSR